MLDVFEHLYCRNKNKILKQVQEDKIEGEKLCLNSLLLQAGWSAR